MSRRCPTGKRMFFGQVAAERAVELIRESNPAGPQRAYRCDKCPTWHITRESGAQRHHRGAWQAKRDDNMRTRANW